MYRDIPGGIVVRGGQTGRRHGDDASRERRGVAVNIRRTVLGGALVSTLALGVAAGPAEAHAAKAAGPTIWPLVSSLLVTDDDSTVFGTSTQTYEYSHLWDQRTV